MYVANNQPIIEGKDITTKAGTEVNLLDSVKATDKEDGDLTGSITYKSNVDFNTPGEYSVTYTVKDKSNFSVSRTFKINVEIDTTSDDVPNENVLENIDKEKTKQESLFYMDYLKQIDGKLVLKGYSTINGINNNLETDISYKVLFENVDTGKIVAMDASRITDKNLITRVPFSEENLDYTYSWFEYKFDLKNVEPGNYKLYVLAQNDKNYSLSVVSNKLYKEQATSFVGDKSIIIYRNFNDKTGAVEFNVRDKVLAEKSSSYIYNQYDTYRAFEFVDNKLHLKGLSYSYGMDLSEKSNVTRKIIFENKKTYEIYSYDLGSITDGLYDAVLPVDDNLDKTRAWYDNTFDITNIPKGEYIIYITTASNITDIAELTEKLGRNLDSVKLELEDKKYSFSINKDKGNRVELKVE